jgi:ATP-dependent DNA helicase RecQ
LRYFGDEYGEDCGNCDNCLAPPATWDATDAARKLLSAVHRTGQYFGAAHIVDVLLGKSTEKVRARGHDKLSVFGVGNDVDAQTWRSVVRQLIVQEYLLADPARFGALVLTERCRPLLRGEVTLQLREDARASAPSKRPLKSRTPVAAAHTELWDALRECRKRLAAEHDVPPYVIFHDATLKQMIEHRPTTADELLLINGVGPSKLERYGEAFLEVMRSAN